MVNSKNTLALIVIFTMIVTIFAVASDGTDSESNTFDVDGFRYEIIDECNVAVYGIESITTADST